MNKLPSSLPDDFVVEDLIRRNDLLPNLCRLYVEESIVSIVPLSKVEVKNAQQSLIESANCEDWLAEKGWSQSDFLIAASRDLALKKFAQQEFGRGLEEKFLASRGGRDEIVYSLLRVRDAGLALELYLRIAEGELAFPEAARNFGEGPEARHQGLIGPIPLSQLQPQLLADSLRGLQPGELAKPLSLGEWHLILRLEHFSPARFDDAMRDTLLNEQLEAFLDKRAKLLLAGEPLEPLRFDSDASSVVEQGSDKSADLI